MSSCGCEQPTQLRVSGEVWHDRPLQDRRVIGAGDRFARIRCVDCGGKYGYIGSDGLAVLGIPEEEVYNGRCLEPEQHISLEVDLF